jgi:hypothetical protein
MTRSRRDSSAVSGVRLPYPPRCLITAVWAEVVELKPTEFVAVTVTRMVRPASALVSWYLLAVAPAIDTQAPPEVSQRRH